MGQAGNVIAVSYNARKHALQAAAVASGGNLDEVDEDASLLAEGRALDFINEATYHLCKSRF